MKYHAEMYLGPMILLFYATHAQVLLVHNFLLVLPLCVPFHLSSFLFLVLHTGLVWRRNIRRDEDERD